MDFKSEIETEAVVVQRRQKKRFRPGTRFFSAFICCLPAYGEFRDCFINEKKTQHGRGETHKKIQVNKHNEANGRI